MPVFVTTGGPVSNALSVLEPGISSFTDMINAISDELDDTNNEYLSQIQGAIFTAIRFCEREPLYFNEGCEVMFATVEGREWYDSADAPEMATLARLAKVYCQDGHGGRRMQLQHKTPQALELLCAGRASRGRPQYYAYSEQKLRLCPVPDSAWRLIWLELLPMPVKGTKAADESNPWLREAFDLVKARAKYELYKDILKDAPMAMAAFDDFNEQLAALRAQTSRRNGAGSLRATGF